MRTKEWYRQLKKPSWAPSAKLFSPVWTLIYVLITISFGVVVAKFFQGEISFMVLLPFVLNLVFNALFMPLQFGLMSNELALIDILIVLATLIWAIIVIFPISAWISYIQIPYLLWVGFASVLQFSITLLNR